MQSRPGSMRRVGRGLVAAAAVFCASTAMAQVGTGPTATTRLDNPAGIPDLRKLVPTATDRGGVSATMTILVLMTVLSLAPAILVMGTSFTRTVVVLSLLRQALGTQQLPPGQVIVGLSLILTMITMAPTWRQIQSKAVDPYLAGKMGQTEAFDAGVKPLRDFMIRQIESAHNEEHVYMFMEYTRGKEAAGTDKLKWADVSLVELIPAFVLSELKVSFIMGIRIYLPFLVIDMVISAILISMGMMMLPPVLISLPFKLLLFVMADGWKLVVGSILASFSMG